jgi:glutathione S-transferase
MKLYYAPGACSLSPHIILRELAFNFDLIRVDLATGTLSDGRDFRAINAKGQVPALELEDGTILTEGVAIVQYLADQKPEIGLMPPLASFARAQVQETLNFVSSELHKAFNPLFSSNISPEARKMATANVMVKIGVLEAQLADGREWLVGGNFSPADAYGFVITRWAPMQNISLEQWPNVTRWMDAVGARRAVAIAIAAEG